MREILKAKLPEPGGVSRWTAEGNRARNILICCPARYTGDSDSSTPCHANALTECGREDYEHPFQANFSRSSCLHPLASAPRHHPLTKSFGKNGRPKPSGKKRQKAATNLSQFVAAPCRFLPPFVARRRIYFQQTICHFRQGTRYPLSKQCFYGSPKSRRVLREMLRLVPTVR